MKTKEINSREGIVKWFKGYNSKKKTENDYGFIVDSELGREIYFHESQVKDMNLDLIQSGVVVIYEIQDSQAVNVRIKKVLLFTQEDYHVCEWFIRNQEYELIRKLNVENPEDFIDIQNLTSYAQTNDFLEFIQASSLIEKSLLSILVSSHLKTYSSKQEIDQVKNTLIKLNSSILNSCPELISDLSLETLTDILKKSRLEQLEINISVQILTRFINKVLESPCSIKKRNREGRIKFIGHHEDLGQYGFIEDSEIGSIIFLDKWFANEDLVFLKKGLIVQYSILKGEETEFSMISIKARRNLAINKKSCRGIFEFVSFDIDDKISHEKVRSLNAYNKDDQNEIVHFSRICTPNDLSNLINYLSGNSTEDFLQSLLSKYLTKKKDSQKQEALLIEILQNSPFILNLYPHLKESLSDEDLIEIFNSQWISRVHEEHLNELLNKLLIIGDIKKEGSEEKYLFGKSCSSDFWLNLNINNLLEIYQFKWSLIDIKTKILVLIIRKCEYDSQKLPILASLNLDDVVTYDGSLWNIAPVFIKQKIILKKFSNFFKLLDEWRQYNPQRYEPSIEIACHEAYLFSDEDKALATSWAADNNKINRDYALSTMYSARGAEKAAQIYYARQNFHVDDIAIHQLKNESQDWKSYDLRIKTQEIIKCIDVKNSRQNRENKNRYSEFCVPDFKRIIKENGEQLEVTILGVFSPYIKNLHEQDQNNRLLSGYIKILGEIRKSSLNDIYQRCKTLNLHEVYLETSRRDRRGEYFPPWTFDFPDEFYSYKRRVLKSIRDLPSGDIPNLTDLSLVDQKRDYLQISLSLLLSSNRSVPEKWLKDIDQSFIRFSEILGVLSGDDTSSVALPCLFLAITYHFLENCLQASPGYKPTMYEDILFLPSNPIFPLGIRDPLSTIKEFCKILNKVWENCRDEIHKFKSYRFTLSGIMTGLSRETGEWETIIAYCGRPAQRQSAPCGNEPLYLGHNSTCSICRKLICEKCDFCSKPEYCSRARDVEKARSLSYGFSSSDVAINADLAFYEKDIDDLVKDGVDDLPPF